MRTITHAIADTVERLVRDRKLFWIVSIPSGIFAVLLGLGFVTDTNSLVNVTMVIALAFLVLVVITLALSRRYMRREIGERSELLNRYVREIHERQTNDALLFTTEEWDETTRVSQKGNAEITRLLTLKVGAEPLSAVWNGTNRNSENHLTTAIKKRVKVEARTVNPHGQVGARILTTVEWNGPRMTTYIHFDDVLNSGEEVKVRLHIEWPRFYADMLDGVVEKNRWTFLRVSRLFKSTIYFDKAFAPNGVVCSPLMGSPDPVHTVDSNNGSSTLRLELDNIVANTRVGYHVELGTP